MSLFCPCLSWIGRLTKPSSTVTQIQEQVCDNTLVISENEKRQYREVDETDIEQIDDSVVNTETKRKSGDSSPLVNMLVNTGRRITSNLQQASKALEKGSYIYKPKAVECVICLCEFSEGLCNL